VFTFHWPDADEPDKAAWPGKRLKAVPPAQGEQIVEIGRVDIPETAWRGNLEVSLDFRDSAGRYWRRDRQGYSRAATHRTRHAPSVALPTQPFG
jgi:hypothetical protein